MKQEPSEINTDEVSSNLNNQPLRSNSLTEGDSNNALKIDLTDDNDVSETVPSNYQQNVSLQSAQKLQTPILFSLISNQKDMSRLTQTSDAGNRPVYPQAYLVNTGGSMQTQPSLMPSLQCTQNYPVQNQSFAPLAVQIPLTSSDVLLKDSLVKQPDVVSNMPQVLANSYPQEPAMNQILAAQQLLPPDARFKSQNKVVIDGKEFEFSLKPAQPETFQGNVIGKITENQKKNRKAAHKTQPYQRPSSSAAIQNAQSFTGANTTFLPQLQKDYNFDPQFANYAKYFDELQKRNQLGSLVQQNLYDQGLPRIDSSRNPHGFIPVQSIQQPTNKRILPPANQPFYHCDQQGISTYSANQSSIPQSMMSNTVLDTLKRNDGSNNELLGKYFSSMRYPTTSIQPDKNQTFGYSNVYPYYPINQSQRIIPDQSHNSLFSRINYQQPLHSCDQQKQGHLLSEQTSFPIHSAFPAHQHSKDVYQNLSNAHSNDQRRNTWNYMTSDHAATSSPMIDVVSNDDDQVKMQSGSLGDSGFADSRNKITSTSNNTLSVDSTDNNGGYKNQQPAHCNHSIDSLLGRNEPNRLSSPEESTSHSNSEVLDLSTKGK